MISIKNKTKYQCFTRWDVHRFNFLEFEIRDLHFDVSWSWPSGLVITILDVSLIPYRGEDTGN